MNDALGNFKLAKLRQGLDEARAAAVAADDPPTVKDDAGASPVGDPGEDD